MIDFGKITKVFLCILIVLFFVSCSSDEKTNLADDEIVKDDEQVTVDEQADETADQTVDETEIPDETVDEAIDEKDDEIADDPIDEEADEDNFVPYDPRVSAALCGAKDYKWLQQEELPVGTGLGFILEKKELLIDVQGIAARKKEALTTLMLTNEEVKKRNIKRKPKHDVRIFKIRYQTQDKGKLVDATGIVAFPDKADTFPVISVLHGTSSGFADECAPSADESIEGEASGLGVILASFGYVIIAPDYIGLKSMGARSTELHPYLIAEPTAIAVLDMMRAARNLLQLVDAKAIPGDNAIVGGSQGGHAAAFTTRYQPYYAPELVIKGASWGIPPTDLQSHAKVALQSFRKASGNTALFFLTSNSWYTGDHSNLSEVFVSPFDVDFPIAALDSDCDMGKAVKGMDSLDDLYSAKLLEEAAVEPFMVNMPPWDCYAEVNSLPMSPLPRIDNIPALMVLGEIDDLVDPGIETASFQKLCEQGYQINYKKCLNAGHVNGFTWSLEDQFDWVDARLASVPMTDYCTVKEAVRCVNTPEGE